MRILKYSLKRLLTVIPLLIGVIFIVFVLIRLLPGNPAYRLAGSLATEETTQALIERMGLNKSIPEQFLIYVQDILRGDLGRSWFTNNSVVEDLTLRFPATFELITLSLILALAIGLSVGVFAALNPKGPVARLSNGYGLLAGAVPDFWVALMLIYLLFHVFPIFPAPMGRLGIMTYPPDHITGMYTVDSLLTGNWTAFKDAVAHLALPVIALGIVFAAPVMKMSRSSIDQVLRSNFIAHARLLGLGRWRIAGYAIRNALSPVVTIVGFLYGFLLGGAVLVETVFGWGGLGQYVTQGIANKDYAAIQGFVLLAAVFSLSVYFIVDLLLIMIDPRIEF